LVAHVPGRLLADDVRSLLLYGVDDIYPLNSINYRSKLGTGRLNVFKALQRADSLLAAPAMPAVSSFLVNAACSTVQLSWSIPAPATRVVIAMAAAGENIGLPFGRIYQTGDTLAFGGKIYGKPKSKDDAIARWRLMRGQVGEIHTGHALIAPGGPTLVRDAVTRVYFADVDDDTIVAYVNSGEPLACAGAFSIDGKGGLLIEKIEGCHTNVIGLSLPLLRSMLEQLGYRVTEFW